jgi:hypothetical protein
MGFAELSNVLWRERYTLELLLFKLEAEQLLLAAGRTRWLHHAGREVDVLLDRVQQTGVLRAVESDAITARLGLPPGTSLQRLAGAAREPWGGLLADHRSALLALTAEITALAEASRELLTVGQQADRDAVLTVVGLTEPEEPGTVPPVSPPVRPMAPVS